MVRSSVVVFMSSSNICRRWGRKPSSEPPLADTSTSDRADAFVFFLSAALTVHMGVHIRESLKLVWGMVSITLEVQGYVLSELILALGV